MTAIIPANHPSNRLGEIIFSHPNVGEIRLRKGVYYVWKNEAKCGIDFESYSAAIRYLGQRAGYDEDGFGSNRAGRCIEKYGNGEIWKDRHVYYAWLNGSDSPSMFSVLSHARHDIGVVIQHSEAKTLPKSAHPQNQKGYRADTAGRKK